MEIDQVYERLRTFVVTVIDDESVRVIIRDQVKSPISEKPFITLAISQLTDTSQPMRYETDDFGLQRILLNKVFLVTFESYADITHQAEKLLNRVQNYFGTEIASNHFKGEVVYNRSILGVSAIPTAISGINESRAILEAEFSLVQSVIDDVGLIEHIYITDLNSDREIIINKEQNK